MWLSGSPGGSASSPGSSPTCASKDGAGPTKRPANGFLNVALEAAVIERGDVVHLDFGLVYMGLSSDWQKMAYVLMPGETRAPGGLEKALANTNILQDAVVRLRGRASPRPTSTTRPWPR